MTELTRDALAALIADDEHGLLTPEAKPEPVTNADILANRFEEINTFIDEHGRNPTRTTETTSASSNSATASKRSSTTPSTDRP